MKIYILKFSEYNEEWIYRFGYATDEKGLLTIAKKYADDLFNIPHTAKIDWDKKEVYIYDNENDLVLTAYVMALEPVKE